MENNTTNNTSTRKVVKGRRVTTGLFAVILAAVVGIGGTQIYKKYNPTPTYKLNTTSMSKELDGTVNYKYLTDCSLITLIDLNGNEKYVIGKDNLALFKDMNTKVTNIVNDQVYYIHEENRASEDEVYISKKEDMEDYLITLGYLKEEYTSEDLANIYSSIVDFKQEQIKSKSLTK